jgi:hypothetical protein
VQITVERDQTEFTRLSQLGDILGLTPMEVGMVHKGLADKAFRNQAEQILADGKGLTAERVEKLKVWLYSIMVTSVRPPLASLFYNVEFSCPIA